jgi:D-amino peptidase
MERYEHVLILADIEGSSGCWSYAGSAFKTPQWVSACAELSRDVDAVVRRLFEQGVRQVTVKDFHRTGYNLLPERIDPRCRIVSGYRRGPVPGIGHPAGAAAVLFLGLHAASGTPGFLAHTLTSRIARLTVNSQPLPEVALFAASLAPYRLRPIFFSGCPVACSQAQEVIAGIDTFPIDKSQGPEGFDTLRWRQGLAAAAAASLQNRTAAVYLPQGPFEATVTMRDGERVARKLAFRWGFTHRDADIFLRADSIHTLYRDLIRICYLTPLAERALPLSLALFNLQGRLGLVWLRRQLKKNPPDHRQRGT